MHIPPFGVASSTVITDAPRARLDFPLFELALLHDANLDWWPRWIPGNEKPCLGRGRGLQSGDLPTACERWPNGHHPAAGWPADRGQPASANCL